MDEKGLNCGRADDISVKVDVDKMLITPSGVVKAAMSPEDVLLVSIDGDVLDGGRRPTMKNDEDAPAPSCI